MKLIGIVVLNVNNEEFTIKRVPLLVGEKDEEGFAVHNRDGILIELVLATERSVRKVKGGLPEEGLAHFIMANWDLLHSEVK